MLCCVFRADVVAALLHTLGLLASHSIHTLHTSQQQRVIRCVVRCCRGMCPSSPGGLLGAVIGNLEWVVGLLTTPD